LADPNDIPFSIDPVYIIDSLYKLLPPQLEILTQTFDETLSKIRLITSINYFEEKKLDPASFEKEL
jgi:hypothetical protein